MFTDDVFTRREPDPVEIEPENRSYLAAFCGSVALGSSLASSGGLRTAVGAELGAGPGAAVAPVDVEPESCARGLGASEGGGEAAAVGFTC